MSTEPTELDRGIVDSCTEYLERYYRDALARLAQSYPKDSRSLVVSWSDLLQYDPALADDYLEQPDAVREHLEAALEQVDLPTSIDIAGASVRVADLPETRTQHVTELRRETVGGAVALTGQVSNRTAVRTAARTATFECQRCGSRPEVPQEQFAVELQEPHECPECERQGPFEFDAEASTLRNIQVARVQLPPERSAGQASASVDVLLEGDATGQVDGGDRVTITGTHTLDDDSGIGFSHQLIGDTVTVEETTFSDVDVDEWLDEIRAVANGEYGDPFELLVDSIAPSVVGMDTVKRALALQLFGGVRTQSPDGTTTRGDIHVLLIGDPGTAKSTFLEDIEDKAPNAMMASGKGATAAGLTAAATQIEFAGSSQWALDPGALVLADDGIACIDEIDKVDEDAVESLHQALSKQQVSVSKAGINADLPTRTAVLAAGNPAYGRFDEYESVAEQIDLSPTLLSRFDILWPVNDSADPDADEDIATGMMHHHDQSIRYTRGDIDADETNIDPAIPTELLRAYVAYAKESCLPRWPEGEAREQLIDGFVSLRAAGAGDDQPVPVTYRALESQRRLAEASARIRLSDRVERRDVERARDLYMTAMRQVGVDPETGDLDADVIETGQSRSQRERVRKLLDIIDDLAREYDSGAPRDVLLDRAEDAGISASDAEHELMKLKEKGDVYESEGGHYRAT